MASLRSPTPITSYTTRERSYPIYGFILSLDLYSRVLNFQGILLGGYNQGFSSLSDKFIRNGTVKSPGSTQRANYLLFLVPTAVSMAAVMQATVSSCNEKMMSQFRELTSGFYMGYLVVFKCIERSFKVLDQFCSHIYHSLPPTHTFPLPNSQESVFFVKVNCVVFIKIRSCSN